MSIAHRDKRLVPGGHARAHAAHLAAAAARARAVRSAGVRRADDASPPLRAPCALRMRAASVAVAVVFFDIVPIARPIRAG
jgi:hypothetical protein